MGTWGAGPFQNDSALDFVDDVQSIDVLMAAFKRADSDYIEAGEACDIVVAAECIAALKGFPHSDMPEQLSRQIGGFTEPDPELIALARSSLGKVMAGSELIELWDDAEPKDCKQFYLEMQGLEGRLAKAAS